MAAVPLDQVAIQALIDAALLQQDAQHQADLQAANAANAAALQAAIANIPPPPAGGAPPVPPPIVFALTPGLMNPNQPWNYASSEGLKLFTHASSKLLDVPFNGGVKELKTLLVAAGHRGEVYGWSRILMVSNQAPTPVNKNLLVQYGILTLDDVCASAGVYLALQERPAQMSIQVKNAILATQGPDMMIKLLARKEDYTVNNIEDGACMIKVLVDLVVIQTRATLTVLRTKLRDLPAVMKTVKSNITNFNAEVDDMITSLQAMDEECQDILSCLFEAYQYAGDDMFRKYMRDTEVKWETREIVTLTADDLMVLADARYKVMVEKKTWAKPSKEEADLMALKATIVELETHQTEVVKDKKAPGATPGGRTRGKRVNEGEWAWKSIAPVGNEPKEKQFKNKWYVHCPFHPNTQWVLKAGHEGGCRLDPNFVTGIDKMVAKDQKADKTTPPSKKQLQFAHALIAAMEQEDSGALDGGSDVEG